jgi:L-histidine N-alpha-methyltransferase
MALERFSLVATPARDQRAAFAQDVRRGLVARPKRLSCQYFYDAEGSRRFEEICALPEYYLTRAECAILRAHAEEVIAKLPRPLTLVELGSGSSRKTRLLMDAIFRGQETLLYVPIDVGRGALEESSRQLLREYPGLHIAAVRSEYEEGLRHLPDDLGQPRLFLWLGSSVGNFHRGDAALFLGKVRRLMTSADRFLVGIDLRKERSILEPAYDDARGVTAQFNLNLLARINRELRGHFDVASFRHRAVYQEEIGRVEMYLESRQAQTVRIDRLELEVSFVAGESIHTENAYKYSFAEIDALAAGAGLRVEEQWLDGPMRFSANLLALK